MEKILILTTADEITKGLKKLLSEYSPAKSEPEFETEKMTVAEASNFIDVSYATTCKWIKEGKIPVHGKGRTRFVLKSELIEAYKAIS